jgi:uncharacterized membrane protein
MHNEEIRQGIRKDDSFKEKTANYIAAILAVIFIHLVIKEEQKEKMNKRKTSQEKLTESMIRLGNAVIALGIFIIIAAVSTTVAYIILK